MIAAVIITFDTYIEKSPADSIICETMRQGQDL
jgi:hypothetical protein